MKKTLIALTLAACFNTNAANSDYFLVVPLTPLAAQASTTGTFSLSTSTLNYSNVPLGSSSAAQLTIRNTGSQSQTLGAISVSQNPTEFSVVHNCPAMLSTGASCTATVTYTPTANASTGKLTVAMDPAGTKTVTLRGSSASVETPKPPPQQPEPEPEPTPEPEPVKVDKLMGSATQDLGSLFVGDSNSTTFTLRNDGDGAAALSYGNLPSTVMRSGDCGASLAAGVACSVTLNWTPDAAGALDQTLTISAANSTVDLKLTGVAVAKTFTATVSATSLDFGSINTGTNATQTVTLTNTGNQPLTLASIVGSGISAPYTVSDDCGTSLAPTLSCNATVTYAPTNAGSHNQTLTLGMGVAGNKTVSLSGIGQAVLAESVRFENCASTSGLACMKYTNTGTATIVSVAPWIYDPSGTTLTWGLIDDDYSFYEVENSGERSVTIPPGASGQLFFGDYWNDPWGALSSDELMGSHIALKFSTGADIGYGFTVDTATSSFIFDE